MKITDNQKKEFKLGFIKFIAVLFAVPVIYFLFMLLTLI